mmetsp:Transcript_33813/g.81749  ORF Transcript_33813/g.81749 Transcript_33813/m.81749 type:complete len:266 (+) Transcript_33813:1528-2325(+)
MLGAARDGNSGSHEGLDPAVAFRHEFANAVGRRAAVRALLPRAIAQPSVAMISNYSHGTRGPRHDAIFHGLHPPEAPADDALHGIYLELVLQQEQLQSHRVPHAHVRKVHAVDRPIIFVPRYVRRHVGRVILLVARSCAGRTDAAITASQNITANHEVSIGIERLPRTQQISPPRLQAGIPRQRMAYHQDVIPIRVERAVRVVIDERGIEHAPGQLRRGRRRQDGGMPEGAEALEAVRRGIRVGFPRGVHGAVLVVHGGVVLLSC